MDKQEKKSINFMRIVKMFLLTVFCGVFLFSGYRILSTLLENKQSEEAYQDLRDQLQGLGTDEQSDLKPTGTDGDGVVSDQDSGNSAESPDDTPSIDITTLQKKYPELKAWISADGTGLDYPVMQAEDNTYYLTRLYDGTPNANGSLFLDFRNTGILTDDNTVIYGHNMDNGAMFGNLSKYKAQEFYEKNPTMVITTEEKDYQIELLSGTVEDGDYQFVEFVFDDFEDMKAYVDELRSRSTFTSKIKLKEEDKLISLCTCSYESSNARYMVVGVCR